ncbi:MAG: hypothetical protein KDI02_20340 [Anaerolineae bacterium]|nr:hypothetical protein [Anaerolineae bacterium]MCB0178334.1 hypothetical protein [Anaerolineae bacterium]MCB0226049.1 hypothetical protein [Anaerolineae bacterium]
MIQVLRVRLITAILLALMGIAIVSQVLPGVSGFGGDAHAGECANSTC